MSQRDLSRYRPNVGVVLFNAAGQVWLGRRMGAAGPRNWQFPQGGVDEGEDWEQAARRELWEETGARSVEIIGRTDDWIVYDFPPEMASTRIGRNWAGQKQKWIAMRFTGEDSEFDLAAHHEQEFDQWRWAELDDALDTVASFKREAYAKVIAAFEPLARPG